MTHADYVAQGYPPIYTVDAYDEWENKPVVSIYSTNPVEQTITLHFRTMAEAESFADRMAQFIESWEVEPNTDNPMLDYQRQELTAMKARVAV